MKKLILAFMIASAFSYAGAEPAPLPFTEVPYKRLVSPTVIGSSKTLGMPPMIGFSLPEAIISRPAPNPPPDNGPFVTVEIIKQANAAWLQLKFDNFNLGQASRLTVRSLTDGQKQTFSGESLQAWRGTTAIFNGDTVEVTLEVSPQDSNVFYNVEKIKAGTPLSAEDAVRQKTKRNGTTQSATTEAICGKDDRIPSHDARIGRLVPIGCTGWIIEGGIHLTAGHCIDPDNPDAMGLLQFDVPESNHIGNIQNPAPDKQYRVRPESVVYFFDEKNKGNDWAIFSVEKNTETGKYPIESQGGHVRIAQKSKLSSVKITGYGIDSSPPKANQTQQTDSAKSYKVSVNDKDHVTVEYAVDTNRGNSGAPIIAFSSADNSSDLEEVAIGIHTDGECDKKNSFNTGTAFMQKSLWNAIRNYKDRPKISP